MKKYLFLLVVIALVVAANYYYARRERLHVVLINHSKKAVPVGTPIYFKDILVGKINAARNVNDTLAYTIAEFEKTFCVGASANFAPMRDSLAGTLKLQIVNDYAWDKCMADGDTAFITADSTSYMIPESLMDSIRMMKAGNSTEEYPDSFKFQWPIDSIRCYCWCMVDKSLDSVMRQNQFACTTGTNIAPSLLAKYENYKCTVTSKMKLTEFQMLLSAGHIKKYDLGFDVRLSFVMFSSDRIDTVSFYSHRYMALGNSRIISFDSDISEYLKAFLKDLDIDCRGK